MIRGPSVILLLSIALAVASGCSGRGLTAEKQLRSNEGSRVILLGTATSSNGTIWTRDGEVVTSHVGDTFTATLQPGDGSAYIHGTGTARAISFSKNEDGTPEILVAAGDDVETEGLKFNPETNAWEFRKLNMRTSSVVAVQMQAFEWAYKQLEVFAPEERQAIIETALSQNATLTEVLPEVVSAAANLGIEGMKRIFPVPELNIGTGASPP